MTLPGLLLIVILTSCDAGRRPRRDIQCADCNHSGKWWPLFRPSQIIESEFPEHAHHYLSLRRQYDSQEQTPGEVPPAISLSAELAGKGSAELNSAVRTYNSGGKHRLEWDHYGDVSKVATVAVNSVEDGSDHRLAEDTGQQETPKSEVQISEENNSNNGQKERIPEDKVVEASAEVGKTDSQDSRFFEGGNFFDDKLRSSNDRFPEDFEISKESDGDHDSSNSVEPERSHEVFHRHRRPGAMSYSSMSSVVSAARPYYTQPRDLLHPVKNYNDATQYISHQVGVPMSRSRVFNGGNFTNQYLVHEFQPEHSGVLRTNQRPPPPSRPFPRAATHQLMFPNNHHNQWNGGLHHQYHHHQPISRSSTLHWQDLPTDLRSKFPFKHLQPYVHHQTVVEHDTPATERFSNSIWKESKIIENIKSPGMGRTLYFFKKKPSTIDFKKIARRQGHSHVYIIKNNKRIV